MKGEGRFRFTAEEAFSIPGRGLVVTGKVEEGSISVGTEIGFLATDGKWISALVVAIEISRRLVEEAKVGQRASILLQGVKKEQITLGTVLQDVPVAPVPISSAPAQPSPPPVAAAPPTTSGGEPIHPSSSSWRTILFIIIGILVILGILYLQGKWDPKKWDPKKWDPRKRITIHDDINRDRARHSRESGNPERNWIPPYQVWGRLGQARDDKEQKIYVVLYRIQPLKDSNQQSASKNFRHFSAL